MIDFIEYVVAELKSKRLSKANAISLVQQFSCRAPGSASCIHPLLHSNTSDLNEQRYSSIFTGQEFFLADHQVAVNGHGTQKVLPGVAYLEMTRAAVEQAWPEHPETAALELHNVVWAQPIVVERNKEVGIALLLQDHVQLDYEVYSREADQEIVHCQGSALWSHHTSQEILDIEQLKAQMRQSTLEAGPLYLTCARMGLIYGPALQSITTIYRGNNQVLAQLRLPQAAEPAWHNYVLHPSLMDSALQACVGLIPSELELSNKPRVPFALEKLRIAAPCTKEMFAWVRHASGSQPTGKVLKLDIDLCDQNGKVCIQMRGLSSRLLDQRTSAAPAESKAHGSLLAVPVWQAGNAEKFTSSSQQEYLEHHIILCELSQVKAGELNFLLPHSRCQSLQADTEKNIAQRYSEYALACFEKIHAILQSKPQGKVLLQVVVAAHQEQSLFAGMSGLLKTTALENPQIFGQLILTFPDTTLEELAARLQDEKCSGPDAVVRYQRGTRQVLHWEAVQAATNKPPIVFKDQGVYLITGGLGGLGLLFAKEILAQTSEANVVLTGRPALSAEKQAQLASLGPDSRVTYRQVDLTSLQEVQQLIADITAEHGQLNGILHSAGMIADNFILKKTSAEFSDVLMPKVAGAYNLDQASKDVELDFLVLFSSMAGALGNIGQSDYATANGFMDQFAAYRNSQVAERQRHGLTRSINWGLWQSGGMSVDASTLERMQETTGMQPIQTATGLQAFYRSLTLICDQMLVMEGDIVRLQQFVCGGPRTNAEPQAKQATVVTAIDSGTLTEKTQEYLRRQFSGLLKVASNKIDPRAPLENYGIDSILAMQLTNQLEKTFGSLSKTLFFEYQTIRELADYFVAQYATQLIALFTSHANGTSKIALPSTQSSPSPVVKPVTSRRLNRVRSVKSKSEEAEAIAVIGLSGRYPEAIDIDAYWRNLRDGKDCITEIPKERWDWREYFTEDRTKSGSHFSKWGGFIAGVDEFDPLFFNISPLEAEAIDPQERLFLQHAWMAIEDAGYTRTSLQVPCEKDLPGQVGVYVGLMYSEYQLFGAEASVRGKRVGVAGSFATVANRVSYAFNLHGPSMTLDTMCSSSLSAIHIACQDLKHGRISMAIAGGVNVTIHPNKYLVLSDGQFISSDGHCQSFGEGGDGYIPGEGVGVVVLKRLSEAERDGDHIYGIIRGSALNHGGKTNGYTVPNPQAQASAISKALAEAHVDARHISYIEAHGTGTKLGDPIEITALSKVFQQYTQEAGFCHIGSAKSNIGHCESAAGIAGLTKVLLQLQHRQIVPSLHSEQLNPNIDFPRTPFVVNQQLREWKQPVVDGRKLRRIAGISSFGAGGSNAHMIVEEYEAPVRVPLSLEKVVVVLSARTAEQLRHKASDLLSYVREHQSELDLAAVAYTLQVGREAMEERLGLVVNSAAELVKRLQAWLGGEQAIEDLHQGQMKGNREVLAVFSGDGDMQQTIDKWIGHGKFSKLLELWVKGLEVDWNKLYGENKPQRISLPVYPFARERYWLQTADGPANSNSTTATTAILHPLLHCNTSDLSQQRYSSTFTGQEFFLTDHQVALNGHGQQKVLPGVAYLEMARAAIEHAMPERARPAFLELHNVVWAQPIVVSESKQVSINLSVGDDDEIGYEIYSSHRDQEIVHGHGSARWSSETPITRLDLQKLKAQMTQGTLEPASIYKAYVGMGLVYGPALQGVTAVHRGSNQILAQLRLPQPAEPTWERYVLHPSLLDSALQACMALLQDELATSGKPPLPFVLESLRIASPCNREMFAWVRYASGSHPGDKILKLDIDLCDHQGNVCIQMRGLSSRAMSHEASAANLQSEASGSLMAIPVWQASSLQSDANSIKAEYHEHHIVLCELPGINAGRLGLMLPDAQCLSLQSQGQKNIAQRYTEYALACVERIQGILQSKQPGKALVQIVVSDHQDQALFAGLSGLLKTAALENPQFAGQLILATPGTTNEELAAQLQEEKDCQPQAKDSVIRYLQGYRQVLHWEEATANATAPPVVFKDHGTYLITGGLGGLGVLFAKEILAQTKHAKVVLTGRSAINSEIQARLENLAGQAGCVSYRPLDLESREDVRQLITNIKDEYGELNGILHSAGMIADNFIFRKSSTEFSRVLAPKVTGAYNLDQASQDVELDFFVLFSSIAGAFGNFGQADYATANAFMDQFAAYRNTLVAERQRHGKTRSINWALWQDGGMGVDAATLEMLQRTTGMRPIQTATGMAAFYRSLALPCERALVVEGDLQQMRQRLLGASEESLEVPAHQPAPVVAIDAESIAEKTQDYLRQQFAGVLKLPAHKIDPQAALEDYGIDSVLALKLTNELEKTFGVLSKTLFFEYQTIAALARYFVKLHPAILQKQIGIASEQPAAKIASQSITQPPRSTPASRNRNRFVHARAEHQREIAIVGVAGRYPQARDLQEFWRNLQSGLDCITEIPLDRWDHSAYYDPEYKLAKSYSKWGGFIADVDKFDPLFFNISPKEAALMDPQERLFLETAWETIEDAGYSKDRISGKKVGVFVGVMWGHYELFGAQSILNADVAIPSSSHGSIANRVSYFFDFHGPSIAVDTMCSSSLTAIHLACEELRKGGIEAAIAGGVNLTIHPYKYLSLSQGKFAASDGRCRSFGEGGDGYVPGEGVGAVLLKPLQNALRDGDQIYAVIKSSTLNHGGKTNGYTVPNPNAQAELILDALQKASIDPGTLSYVETHGTGTSLGDPIEITGLMRAFEGSTQEKQFCPIGSVKSNIGHLESAAGIAAVTKALLQIKNDQLVPSLHADPLNPHIDFEASPFYVQTELAEWKRNTPNPRRVGVSSFGAGGANAHLILEEYIDARDISLQFPATSPEVFLLSARDHDTLCRYAERVTEFLECQTEISLSDAAYTSQVGRTPLDVRLAIVASSLDDLKGKLGEWISQYRNKHSNSDLPDVFCGNIREAQSSARNLMQGNAGKAFVASLLAGRDLEKIAGLWTLGIEIDWSLMDRQQNPRKVSMPTYPFSKERCWIEQAPQTLRAVQKSVPESKAEPAKIMAAPRTGDKQRTYYYPQWVPTTLIASGQKRETPGPILILDSSERLFLAMKQRESGSIVLVKPGASFQELRPNIYLLNPEREEHVQKLVEVLKSKSLLPAVVLHRCDGPCNLAVEGEVLQHLNSGVFSLLYLTRALIKEKRQTPLRMLSVFSSSSEVTNPLGSAVGGFFRTLSQENPKCVARTIEIHSEAGKNDELSLPEKCGLIWDEIYEPNWTTQEVRYVIPIGANRQKASRCVKELVSYLPAEKKSSTLPLRKKGVYLITGGLGGLGLIFAEYLARNFAAKLILIGRSAPKPAQQAKLKQLKSYGAEVLTLQADVSSLEDVQKVVRETKTRFSGINGVIHAAGVNRDALILNKTKSDMDSVLAPKVYGTINVDLATSRENLDFFVLFSSIAGVIGNVGQSDYAFGNHFLDSFSEHRENLRKAQKRAGRTLSINWPLWEEGGMDMTQNQIAVLEKQIGISPLPVEEGIHYWEDCLRSELLQAVALYGIPSKIAAAIDQKPATARIAAPPPVERVSANILMEQTEAYLKVLVGQQIQLDPDRIGSSDRFESFGIDSVMIANINSALANDLGPLPKTLLYEHQTVQELATFLVSEAREALTGLFGSCDSSTEFEVTATPNEEEEFPNGANMTQEPAEDATVFAKTEEYLKSLIGREIQLAPERIGSSDRFESYGIDSVMISQINAALEQDLGPLPKTLLYEHQTVEELATFLLQDTREALVMLLGDAEVSCAPAIAFAASSEDSCDEISSSSNTFTGIAMPVNGLDHALLHAKTEEHLKAIISEEIRLAADRIGSSDRLESFGIDSVMISHINVRLEQDLGTLPKTLLYEYQTVHELAQFLLQEKQQELSKLLTAVAFSSRPSAPPVPPHSTSRGITSQALPSAIKEEAAQVEVLAPKADEKLDQIAVIGVHMRFPHSPNLEAFWENLKQGKDLIDLVPLNRWDYEEFYDPDPAAARDGKIYCKWGGFLNDHDKFDPRFFNISTEEAKLMDPQERLFIESIWGAIEDAGYTRDSLKQRFSKARSADLGIFVGVTTNSYHLWGPEERNRGNIVCPSSMPWAIANRASYLFDFNGPSIAVDTACSSSLVAVHLACESLKNRECQLAVAGGVNLYLHPLKYLSLCQKRMASLDGKCRSYGAGDDGFVPGEGVGALLLKPLSKAIEDRDQIYAVISASAFEHTGRSAAYSAPNPQAQANIISRTLNKANAHPETITYVEGHGTGTQLGDSIEISALIHAFQKQTAKKQFCPVGCVKANIGHSESAAGVASLAKVILQMKHGQLAPTIHSDEPNPDIEFKDSPFYLQHGLSEWKPSSGSPRRALINSFGAGGVNACIVLEEYRKPDASYEWRKIGPSLFTLSARNEGRLHKYVDRLLNWFRGGPQIDLADLCYTLQVGRESMEERLAVVVSSVKELIDRLDVWSTRRPAAHIYHGSLGPRRGTKPLLKPAKVDLVELASKWTTGEEIDWESLYSGSKPCRISLPTYPFARERYWISDAVVPEKRTIPTPQLHPLISSNSSTLREISFTSILSETAFYAADHGVNGERIFPGAAFLEMACMAGIIAGEQRVSKIMDVVWVQPLSFQQGPQTLRTSLKNAGDLVEYVVSSVDDENETVVHSEGKLALGKALGGTHSTQERIDIEELKAQCAGVQDGAAYYDKLRKHGAEYGPSFQSIQELYTTGSFALAKLKLPDHLKQDFSQFILHPSLIDGALLTAAGLVGTLESARPHLPFSLEEMDILHPVRQTCYAYAEFAGPQQQHHTGFRKFNIWLLNESGDVLIKFNNLSVRALTSAQPGHSGTAGLAVVVSA